MEGLDGLIMRAEDLHQQGISYNSALTEFIFKGKQFKKYLSFRRSLIESGIAYCKLALGRKELCFLVLEETTFTIWRAAQRLESAEATPLGQGTSQSPPPQAAPLLAPAQTIEPEFLDRCRQIMIHYIGPAANQHIQATLTQFQNLTHRQFVDKLAMHIPDPQQAEEFWQRVLTGIMPSEQQPTAPTSSPATVNQRSQELPNSQFKRTYRGISY